LQLKRQFLSALCVMLLLLAQSFGRCVTSASAQVAPRFECIPVPPDWLPGEYTAERRPGVHVLFPLTVPDPPKGSGDDLGVPPGTHYFIHDPRYPSQFAGSDTDPCDYQWIPPLRPGNVITVQALVQASQQAPLLVDFALVEAYHKLVGTGDDASFLRPFCPRMAYLGRCQLPPDPRAGSYWLRGTFQLPALCGHFQVLVSTSIPDSSGGGEVETPVPSLLEQELPPDQPAPIPDPSAPVVNALSPDFRAQLARDALRPFRHEVLANGHQLEIVAPGPFLLLLPGRGRLYQSEHGAFPGSSGFDKVEGGRALQPTILPAGMTDYVCQLLAVNYGPAPCSVATSIDLYASVDTVLDENDRYVGAGVAPPLAAARWELGRAPSGVGGRPGGALLGTPDPYLPGHSIVPLPREIGKVYERITPPLRNWHQEPVAGPDGTSTQILMVDNYQLGQEDWAALSVAVDLTGLDSDGSYYIIAVPTSAGGGAAQTSASQALQACVVDYVRFASGPPGRPGQTAPPDGRH